jgi:hypothetical protein
MYIYFDNYIEKNELTEFNHCNLLLLLFMTEKQNKHHIFHKKDMYIYIAIYLHLFQLMVWVHLLVKLQYSAQEFYVIIHLEDILE